MTQVPPTRYSSAIATLAPWPAAMRAARTPPEPAPITNRSKSKLVMLLASSRAVAVVSTDQPDAVRPGNDCQVGDAKEQPVLHHAGDELQRLIEVLGVGDAA